PSPSLAYSGLAREVVARERAPAHLGDVQGPGTCHPAGPLVAPAAGGPPVATGGGMRQPVELRRRRSIRGGGQQELRERVGVMRIAAELGDEDVRGERRDGGWDAGAARSGPRIG